MAPYSGLWWFSIIAVIVGVIILVIGIVGYFWNKNQNRPIPSWTWIAMGIGIIILILGIVGLAYYYFALYEVMGEVTRTSSEVVPIIQQPVVAAPMVEYATYSQPQIIN